VFKIKREPLEVRENKKKPLEDTDVSIVPYNRTKLIYLYLQVAEFEPHVPQSSSNSVQFTFFLSPDAVIQLQTISREIE
jgi:hypothetical protein